MHVAKIARVFAVLPAFGLLLAANSALADSAPDQGKPNHAEQGRHHGPGNGARIFERWDQDNDGHITIAVLPPHLQQRIRAIDLNKDGILTRDEFEKGKQQLAVQRQQEFDRNGDGKVTEQERRETMRDHLAERFVEQDKNRDGALTETEVGKEHFLHMKSADSNSDSKVTLEELLAAFEQGKLHPAHRGAQQTAMKARAQQRFNAGDKNHDGFLTESEVPQRWAHLKVADANADNKVTFDELTDAFRAGKLGKSHHHPWSTGSRQQ